MAIQPASQENSAAYTGGATNQLAYPFCDPIFQQFNVQQYYTQSGVVSSASMYDAPAPELPKESDAEKGVGHTKAEK